MSTGSCFILYDFFRKCLTYLFMFSLLNAICLALAGHGDSKRVNKFSNCWQVGTVTTSLGIFVTISLGKQPLTNENLYGRLPKVTEKKKLCSSLRSWRLFCCVFSLVVRRVRDSAARKLNRGRKRKRWGRGRGEKAVRKTSPAPPFPIVLFFVLGSAFAWLNILFYEPQIKRKNSPKNCQLRRLVVQLLHLAGHCLRQPNTIDHSRNTITYHNALCLSLQNFA